MTGPTEGGHNSGMDGQSAVGSSMWGACIAVATGSWVQSHGTHHTPAPPSSCQLGCCLLQNTYAAAGGEGRLVREPSWHGRPVRCSCCWAQQQLGTL